MNPIGETDCVHVSVGERLEEPLISGGGSVQRKKLSIFTCINPLNM